MSGLGGSPASSFFGRFLAGLRYPHLFVILGTLLLVDLVIPDPLPMVDELILAVLTVLSATLTARRGDGRRDRGDEAEPGDALPPGKPDSSGDE